MAMKNEKISPNMANSSFVSISNIHGDEKCKDSLNMANYSFVRINDIYGDEKCKDFAKYGEFVTCKNNYIHGDEKCKYFAIWRIFPQKNCFLKNHPPPQERKKERKKKGLVKRRRKEGCNEWETEPWCVWFKLWLSFAKYALWMGCALLNPISHTTPPSLSLSLSSRAQDKTSSAHLTTNPLPLFLSGSRPSEQQGECGGNETQAVLSLYGKLMPIRSQRLKTVCLVPVLEHLHQRSVCGSALEILDEVQQSNPVNQGYNNNNK
jgi:hypothetical protein